MFNKKPYGRGNLLNDSFKKCANYTYVAFKSLLLYLFLIHFMRTITNIQSLSLCMKAKKIKSFAIVIKLYYSL